MRQPTSSQVPASGRRQEDCVWRGGLRKERGKRPSGYIEAADSPSTVREEGTWGLLSARRLEVGRSRLPGCRDGELRRRKRAADAVRDAASSVPHLEQPTVASAARLLAPSVSLTRVICPASCCHCATTVPERSPGEKRRNKRTQSHMV